jgi:DNA-binding PadR family transcriptional regulator
MHMPWDDDGFMRGRGRARRGGGDWWTGMWGDWMRGPTPRAERGTVRWLVLDAIAAQPRHGYEIIQAIAERSRGTYKPSPGVVYPTLQMLEELGHARTVTRDERKTYEITAEGRKELAEHAEEVSDFYGGGDGDADDDWEQYAGEIGRVMKRVARVAHTLKRGMRHGSVRPSTMRKMRAILDDALGKIEDLLADEEG